MEKRLFYQRDAVCVALSRRETYCVAAGLI
jgi:hypothetical protein